MTKIPITLIVLLIALSSGCVKEEIDTTMYICQDGSELYLHSDGRYHIYENSEAFYGNYTEINDYGRLFIDVECLGISFMLTKNGTDYMDDDGEIWSLVTGNTQ